MTEFAIPQDSEPTLLEEVAIVTEAAAELAASAEVAIEQTVANAVEVIEHSRIARMLSNVRHGSQVAIAVAAISPANEIVRGAIFTDVYTQHSHSPIAGALALGLSTLVIEQGGASAAAHVFATRQSNQKYMDKVNARIKPEQGMSRYSKFVSTLIGGSAVGMAIEQRQNPNRTLEQNRRYGVITSTWLAGACALAGAGGTETVNVALNNPIVAGSVAGSAVIYEGGRRIAKRLRRSEGTTDEVELWRDSDKRYTYNLVANDVELKKAGILEQQVWDENDYGNLEEEGYTKYIEHSRTFVAFDGEDCVGMTRMFNAGEDVLPPFLDMEYDDETEKAAIATRAEQGLVEELGTAAVAETARHQGVNLRLWRMAYRDARARGIESWGIIMEPERVQRMNDRHGFAFRQVGPAVDYQGGDCAPFIMDLQEVSRRMQWRHPLNHTWFVRKALKP